jgi:hypothetical protein
VLEKQAHKVMRFGLRTQPRMLERAWAVKIAGEVSRRTSLRWRRGPCKLEWSMNVHYKQVP